MSKNSKGSYSFNPVSVNFLTEVAKTLYTLITLFFLVSGREAWHGSMAVQPMKAAHIICRGMGRSIESQVACSTAGTCCKLAWPEGCSCALRSTEAAHVAACSIVNAMGICRCNTCKA